MFFYIFQDNSILREIHLLNIIEHRNVQNVCIYPPFSNRILSSSNQIICVLKSYSLRQLAIIKFWVLYFIWLVFDSPWKQTTTWLFAKVHLCAHQALWFAEKNNTQNKNKLNNNIHTLDQQFQWQKLIY